MARMKELTKTAPPSASTDLAALSFEQAMQELETIVRRLETGDGSLEASLADYARGTLLRTHCATMLVDAKMKVELIVKQSDGSLSLTPFDN
jgi:exodeoxyribonuclease VII small subunit